MFAATAALNRRNATISPTANGIRLMIGSSLLTPRAAKSNVRQGIVGVTKKRGTEAPSTTLGSSLVSPMPAGLAQHLVQLVRSWSHRPRVCRRYATDPRPRSGSAISILSEASRISPTVFSRSAAKTFRIRVGNRMRSVGVSSGSSGVGSSSSGIARCYNRRLTQALQRGTRDRSPAPA